ncbi:microcephalin [Pelomyxa schiedti]|nr:microcephalin [Pelomyxa schiedti]
MDTAGSRFEAEVRNLDIDPDAITTEQELLSLLGEVWPEATLVERLRVKSFWIKACRIPRPKSNTTTSTLALSLQQQQQQQQQPPLSQPPPQMQMQMQLQPPISSSQSIPLRQPTHISLLCACTQQALLKSTHDSPPVAITGSNASANTNANAAFPTFSPLSLVPSTASIGFESAKPVVSGAVCSPISNTGSSGTGIKSDSCSNNNIKTTSTTNTATTTSNNSSRSNSFGGNGAAIAKQECEKLPILVLEPQNTHASQKEMVEEIQQENSAQLDLVKSVVMMKSDDRTEKPLEMSKKSTGSSSASASPRQEAQPEILQQQHQRTTQDTSVSQDVGQPLQDADLTSPDTSKDKSTEIDPNNPEPEKVIELHLQTSSQDEIAPISTDHADQAQIDNGAETEMPENTITTGDPDTIQGALDDMPTFSLNEAEKSNCDVSATTVEPTDPHLSINNDNPEKVDPGIAPPSKPEIKNTGQSCEAPPVGPPETAAPFKSIDANDTSMSDSEIPTSEKQTVTAPQTSKHSATQVTKVVPQATKKSKRRIEVSDSDSSSGSNTDSSYSRSSGSSSSSSQSSDEKTKSHKRHVSHKGTKPVNKDGTSRTPPCPSPILPRDSTMSVGNKPFVCTFTLVSQKRKLEQMVSDLGGDCTPEIEEHTTHLLCGSDRRSLKLMTAIAKGLWVLDVKWLSRSHEANKLLSEEEFEMKATFPGASVSRKAHENGTPGIFHGFTIFLGSGTNSSRESLEELIKLAGGATTQQLKDATLCILSPNKPCKCPLVSESWLYDSIQNYKPQACDAYPFKKKP